LVLLSETTAGKKECRTLERSKEVRLIQEEERKGSP
jgi:hypothetical protein